MYSGYIMLQFVGCSAELGTLNPITISIINKVSFPFFPISSRKKTLWAMCWKPPKQSRTPMYGDLVDFHASHELHVYSVSLEERLREGTWRLEVSFSPDYLYKKWRLVACAVTLWETVPKKAIFIRDSLIVGLPLCIPNQRFGCFFNLSYTLLIVSTHDIPLYFSAL